MQSGKDIFAKTQTALECFILPNSCFQNKRIKEYPKTVARLLFYFEHGMEEDGEGSLAGDLRLLTQMDLDIELRQYNKVMLLTYMRNTTK